MEPTEGNQQFAGINPSELLSFVSKFVIRLLELPVEFINVALIFEAVIISIRDKT